MNIHHLKTLPQFFGPIIDGKKTFEVRYNDRAYEIGDILVLEEYDHDKEGNGFHTGRSISVTVTYMTDYGQQPGWVVMAIRREVQRG